jgi:uncharacterized Zn finger protein
MNNGPMPQISIKDAETVRCESCQNETFQEVLAFKKVSKLLTGSKEDSLVPIPVYKCDECGHINPEFAVPE